MFVKISRRDFFFPKETVVLVILNRKLYDVIGQMKMMMMKMIKMTRLTGDVRAGSDLTHTQTGHFVSGYGGKEEFFLQLV